MSTIDQTHVPQVIVAAGEGRNADRVSQILGQNGFQVIAVEQLEELSGKDPSTHQVDVIYADIDEESDHDLDMLDELIDKSSIPVIFSDSSRWTDFENWGRRIAFKLVQSIDPSRLSGESRQTADESVQFDSEHLPQSNQEQVSPGIPESGAENLPDCAEDIPVLEQIGELAADPHQKVWVLGASLGGPDVVKAFLQAVPDTPDVCMILAQHIGENFAELMASQLNRVTTMEVRAVKNGDRIKNGMIYIAPVEERLKISRDGVIYFDTEIRPRLYKPCIDFVMEEVALRYGKQAGAIVFSGMGDDGTEGVKIIARCGGTVWAQTAETCVISSMPDCARGTGYVSFSGSPEMLALRLVQEISVPRSEQFENVLDFHSRH